MDPDEMTSYERNYFERQNELAVERAARKAEENAQRVREHEAFARFCGLLSPIGRII